MKRVLLILSVILMCHCHAGASDRVVERTYVSTDRQVYVAGDVVWCSVFCRDLTNGGFSGLSSVAYLELHSPDGAVQEAKIALVNGRGAGSFTLPVNLPTGNYKLIAYTAQNRNELGYDFECVAPKILSVFNVFTRNRVKDGVKVVDSVEYVRSSSGDMQEPGRGVELSAGKTVRIRNTSLKPVTVSVSVYHDDGIRGAGGEGVTGFAERTRHTVRPEFTETVMPDYEGEIINARLIGLNPRNIPQLVGKFAFISAPGNKSDVYSARIDESGKLRFITGNIYSDKDILCEIEGVDSTLSVHVELESPFVNPAIGAAPELLVSRSIAGDLLSRAAAMQIESRFASDTLLDRLPIRDNLLFDSKSIQYRLDDYTRFPTMKEEITEFISQMRVRKLDGAGQDIQVKLENDYHNMVFSNGTSLMMLDGVPVFDHEKILAYDPALVETVNIYPYTYYVGERIYEGIVNFVTYTGNLPSMKFNDNVRVLEYNGVSVPAAYTCGKLAQSDDYPDYRQTIYWHPLSDIPAGGEMEVKYVLPDYKGRFTVVVEGMTADGDPVCNKISFNAD